eukprot:5859603-Amphidinium_carterae.1
MGFDNALLLSAFLFLGKETQFRVCKHVVIATGKMPELVEATCLARIKLSKVEALKKEKQASFVVQET